MQILEVRIVPGPLCYFSFILYYGSFILCLSWFVLVSFPLSLSFSLFCFLVVVLSHCFCVWVLFYTVFISFVVLSCFFSAFGLYDLVSSFFFSLVFIVSCLSLAVYLSLLINFTIPISPACLVEVPIAVNQNPSSQCQLLLFLVLNSVSFFLHPVEIRPFQGWFAHICSFVPHNWEHVLRSKSFYIDFDSIRWRFHRKCFKKKESTCTMFGKLQTWTPQIAWFKDFIFRVSKQPLWWTHFETNTDVFIWRISKNYVSDSDFTLW